VPSLLDIDAAIKAMKNGDPKPPRHWPARFSWLKDRVPRDLLEPVAAYFGWLPYIHVCGERFESIYRPGSSPLNIKSVEALKAFLAGRAEWSQPPFKECWIIVRGLPRSLYAEAVQRLPDWPLFEKDSIT
jgi:hypothetical protein